MLICDTRVIKNQTRSVDHSRMRVLETILSPLETGSNKILSGETTELLYFFLLISVIFVIFAFFMMLFISTQIIDLCHFFHC